MEPIKFNERYFKEVKKYLNENYKNGKESEMFGLIYTDNERNMLFLQKRENLEELYGVVILSRKHPDFEKIKRDLEELTKEN